MFVNISIDLLLFNVKLTVFSAIFMTRTRLLRIYILQGDMLHLDEWSILLPQKKGIICFEIGS